MFRSFTVECYIMFLNVTNVCIFNRFKYFQQKTSLSLIIRHIYINGEKKSLHVPTHFLIKWKFNKESNIRIRAFHNWFNQIITHSGIYTDFIVEYVEKKIDFLSLKSWKYHKYSEPSPFWIWVNPDKAGWTTEFSITFVHVSQKWNYFKNILTLCNSHSLWFNWIKMCNKTYCMKTTILLIFICH